MSVFSSLKPKGNNQRNAFDLTRRDVFSLKPGMLVPCFVQHTLPDSTYKVDHLSICRTNAIQTAAFARMKVNVDYFFVPYHHIYKDFEKLYYERGETFNSTGSKNVSTSESVPVFSLNFVYEQLWAAYVESYIIYYGRAYAASIGINVADVDYAFSLVQDNVINNGYFRDVHGRICVEDMIRNLEMLGYPNLLPLFKNMLIAVAPNLYTINLEANNSDERHIDAHLKALRDAIQSSNLSFSIPAWYRLAAQDIDNDIQRLPPIEQLLEQISHGTYDSEFAYKPNVFSISSYLKIFSDYYRNAQYDNENYAFSYNYDYVMTTNQAESIPNSNILECLKPRYRQYKKDRYTGLYPNAQFGSVAVMQPQTPFNLTWPVSYGSGSNMVTDISGDPVMTGVNGSKVTFTTSINTDDTFTPIPFNGDISISALAVRQALSFQRYKERILRAGTRVKSLQNAVFGDTSRYVQDQYCDLIGSFDYNIDFNSVAATSNGADVNLGELGANGVGTSSNHAFTYHSHDFGVIMGIMYIVPEAEYENYGIDAFNTKSESFDWYKPDFANLGLAPVFNSDVNSLYHETRNYNNGSFNNIDVIGYLARYWEYKTAVDHVHGEFYSRPPFNVQQYFAILAQGAGGNYVNMAPGGYDIPGAFSHYVTPRDPKAFHRSFLSSLYIEPSCVDGIFYDSVDERQITDNFKFNCTHMVSAVLPMSVIGLPS